MRVEQYMGTLIAVYGYPYEQYMGSVPHAAQRVSWANVAQVEGLTEGGEDTALQEVCADGGLQVANGEAAGNDADGGTSCFQGAEL